MHTTLRAMKRIEELREKRQKDHYHKRYGPVVLHQMLYVAFQMCVTQQHDRARCDTFFRMEVKKKEEYNEGLAEIEKNIDFIKSPAATLPAVVPVPKIKAKVLVTSEQSTSKSKSDAMED
jgi:hypothetical protein